MSEEKEVTQNIETGKEATGMTPDYLEAIKDLKSKTVSREDYEKLHSENKRLLDVVLNARPNEENAQVEVLPTQEELAEIRKVLFNTECELSNLEYVAKALVLRDALIKSGKDDPFLPHSQSRNPTPENIETANRVATILQECVDKAEGSNEIFTAELMRRMK